jgi:hypothetical protein
MDLTEDQVEVPLLGDDDFEWMSATGTLNVGRACQRCKRIWDYEAKNEFVAPCNHCHTSASIKKAKVL